jgi:pimeloyl-ACP methyl ester carboxylesterase
VSLLRETAWRVADYAYAAARQVAGLLSRTTPDAYTRPSPARGPAVLLLPGVWESWRFLEPLARALHDRGHPVHVVAPFGLNRQGVPHMADLAAAHVLEADLRDVVVVAHSKGGLIGKSLMGRADVGDRVLGMVAINTPFSPRSRRSGPTTGGSCRWRPCGTRTSLGAAGCPGRGRWRCGRRGTSGR